MARVDVINRDWARGCRILLTGHTGFKGAWLALWLEQLGAEVVGFSLSPEPGPNLFVDADVAPRMHSSRIGDLRDDRAIASCVREARPELILHLAAQPLVRRSYREPLTTFETNVMGTARLLEATRSVDSVRAIIVVTSDKCYDNAGTQLRFAETAALGGHDPYSASKAGAELVAAAYRNAFLAERGIAVATARAGNVIGGGDWGDERLVPDLVRAARSGTPVRLRNPNATRPWQHVLESLHGYLALSGALLSHGGAFAEAWNFGPDDLTPISVREVATALQRAWPAFEVIDETARDAMHEAPTLALDSRKARERLQWSTRLDFAETIEWTQRWYRAFCVDRVPAHDLVAQDIARYESISAGGAKP